MKLPFLDALLNCKVAAILNISRAKQAKSLLFITESVALRRLLYPKRLPISLPLCALPAQARLCR